MMMHMLLMAHYLYGGYYPIGGASEIAMNIIPVIEKHGGRVLVRADVKEIMVDQSGKACGMYLPFFLHNLTFFLSRIDSV